MSVLSSGILRNRFRVTLSSGLEAPGFIYDKSRMPGEEIDNGSAVGIGSFWDGDNSAFEDKFHLIEVSGILHYVCTRSNLTEGQPFLIAGIGDNDDLELSGIDINISGTSWYPVIEPGIFFDLDTRLYLYSQDAIETIISGSNLFVDIAIPVASFKPVNFASFHVNEWGRARTYEAFRQKHSFTSTNESGTFTQISGIDEPLYDKVIWDNVNTSGFEFFVDAHESGIVRNREITSGVYSLLHRVPWSNEYIQLPLIPIVDISQMSIYVFADPIHITNGSGAVTLWDYGPANPYVTNSGYVRISGGWDEISGTIPTIGTTTSFLSSGWLLIDDDDFRQEIVFYSTKSTSGFTGITRGQQGTSASIHRDGAQIRQLISGTFSAGYIVTSGIDDLLVNYRVDMSASWYSCDQFTGLTHIPILSGCHRVKVQTSYDRGLLLCYEPSGLSEYLYRASGIDISPLAHGVEHGIVWASMFPLRPAKIKLDTSRSKNTDGTVGPVYAGNDFLVVNAKVLTKNGAPVPKQDVTMVLENPVNAGFVNAEDPGQELIRVSDGAGVARFVYTPPDTIQGLGYFIPSGNLSGSGLALVSDIPIEEVWSEAAGYKCLLFSVSNNDTYTTYSQTSGAFDFTADGRFELVTVLSGTSDTTGYTIWKAVEPVALLDSGNIQVTTSGSRISKIVFPAASIPSDTTIGAYFVSVERRVSIGTIIPGSNVTSESLEVIVGIPRFMTGEFLFGPVDAPDTSAFDSLAYLTINPFERRNPIDARQDPRTLGHVFRIRGSQKNQLRHKFYIGIDYGTLSQTENGQDEIRKIHALRNRFILEIK